MSLNTHTLVLLDIGAYGFDKDVIKELQVNRTERLLVVTLQCKCKLSSVSVADRLSYFLIFS